jgi:4-hydroxy-tetrahydrodipicolinate reductase
MAGVAVFGITGRMGQSLIRALREPRAPPLDALRFTGALAAPSSSHLGRDAAIEGDATGVKITADVRAALEAAAVALDFSVPDRVADHARACTAAQVPLLIGTTGIDAASHAQIEAAAQHIPVLIAPNTSVGVAALAQAVAFATAALGREYDVEISEAHHRMKRDAPSGTALALAEVVAAARGQALAEVAVFDRHGASQARAPGSIGFAVVRAGDIVGEHTVTFAAAGERLEMTHRATDRLIFARGALRAAAWLIGRAPGLYGMQNVLGR